MFRCFKETAWQIIGRIHNVLLKQDINSNWTTPKDLSARAGNSKPCMKFDILVSTTRQSHSAIGFSALHSKSTLKIELTFVFIKLCWNRQDLHQVQTIIWPLQLPSFWHCLTGDPPLIFKPWLQDWAQSPPTGEVRGQPTTLPLAGTGNFGQVAAVTSTKIFTFHWYKKTDELKTKLCYTWLYMVIICRFCLSNSFLRQFDFTQKYHAHVQASWW